MTDMQPNLLFTVVWVFGWVVLLIVIWQLKVRAKEREIERRHKERMLAMEKGVPLPELPPDQPRESPITDLWLHLRLNPKWPLGLGALFIMVGIGTTLGLYLSGEQYQHDHASLGLIAVFFGLGLWLHYLLTRR